MIAAAARFFQLGPPTVNSDGFVGAATHTDCFSLKLKNRKEEKLGAQSGAPRYAMISGVETGRGGAAAVRYAPPVSLPWRWRGFPRRTRPALS